MRTNLLAAIAMTGLLTASAYAQVGSPAPPNMTLTLLGTAGGPGAQPERAGFSNLIKVGGTAYVVDAGAGVSRQLARAGVHERDVRVLFLTHLHDDHTAGLPALMTFAYTLRSPGMQLIGPPNTKALYDGIAAMMATNAEIRAVENGPMQPMNSVFTVKEASPGVIYDDGMVKVAAIENTHYRFPPQSPLARNRSYALRFSTPSRTIVFTGDTGPDPHLVEFAKGADVLVSEMASEEDVASVPLAIRPHMVESHLSPSQAGQLAAAAGVKTLVLSHLRIVSDKDIAEVRRAFTGKVVIGRDLDRF